MDGVNQLITWGLRVLRAAAVCRGGACLIRIAMCPEEANIYRRRLRNLLLFVIAAESIGALIDLIGRHYGIS